MMQTNNKTFYGIQDNVERYTLITWTLIVLASSIVGDSVILLATIKYNAIKLNKVIVVVIQHLAVCDLILALFVLLPTTVDLIADHCVMGEVFANIEVHIPHACYPAQRLLICAMTVLKLMLLKYPLRSASWSSRYGHNISCVMWTVVLCVYAPLVMGFLFYIRNTLHFDYVSYSCHYDLTSPDAPTWVKNYHLIFINLAIIIPCTVLLVTSILILMSAKKAVSRCGGTLRLEGVLTVLLTVGLLFVSFLPYCVMFVAWHLGHSQNNTWYRATHFLSFLNLTANFFVCSLAVKSFRNFLKLKMSQLFFKQSFERSSSTSKSTLARTTIQRQFS